MSQQALQRLLEGNRRYVANQISLDASPSRRVEVAQGQKPFAIVLSCVDSRVSPELIFDQGLGELFVIRTAGEVLDRAALGSLEFGVEELHIPLLVVLGHERCGAVKAAMEVLGGHAHAQGDISYLVEALAPAVEQAKHIGVGYTEIDEADLWEEAGREQVVLQAEQLKRAPILAQAVQAQELKIVGAWYSLDTGVVEVIFE